MAWEQRTIEFVNPLRQTRPVADLPTHAIGSPWLIVRGGDEPRSRL